MACCYWCYWWGELRFDLYPGYYWDFLVPGGEPITLIQPLHPGLDKKPSILISLGPPGVGGDSPKLDDYQLHYSLLMLFENFNGYRDLDTIGTYLTLV
jgi:hypothetical protein